jgi:hypothetical protein
MAFKPSRTQRRGAKRAARKYLRRGIAAGLVAFGACDTFAPDNRNDRLNMAEPAPPTIGSGRFGFPTQVPPPVAVAAGMAAVAFDAGVPIGTDLSADMVSAGSIARNVLYSWTTAQQVAELRADPKAVHALAEQRRAAYESQHHAERVGRRGRSPGHAAVQ